MSSSTIIPITARCHCTFFSSSSTYALPDFPIRSAICHCTTCRHVSGHLFTTLVVIPTPHATRPDVSALSAYQTSEAVTRYFCPRCGARVIIVDDEEWEFATGVLDRMDGGTLLDTDGRVQLCIQDTMDGGAGIWLGGRRGGDEGKARERERYMGPRGKERVGFDEVKHMSEESRAAIRTTGRDVADEVLHASCHCGVVQFEIARPEGSGRESVQNRYPAGLDACTSCRTVTGCEITSWAFMPKNRISMPGGKPLELAMAGMSHYDTSPGVHRTFCGTCGASVFCYRGTRETDTIDIAVGLLESKVGARAEDWLMWDHDGDKVVHWAEDAPEQGIVAELIKGISNDDGEL